MASALVFTLAVTAGTAVGYAGEAEDKAPNGFPVLVELKEDHGLTTFAILRDWETDVMYLYVSTPYGVALTPRLNADGTLYTGISPDESGGN